MRASLLIASTLAFLTTGFQLIPDSGARPAPAGYIGFDRNDYPGDSNLRSLRQTFSYSGYWLNHPPGAKTNSWSGKRKILEAAGFGFLVLFNGRTYAEIKAAGDAARLGSSDAAAAVSAARAEGFPSQTIIFLDQEQGGRLLPEQRAYLHALVDAVNSAQFLAGVYCSGIAAREGSGASIVTAEDIRKNAAGRKIKYWVVNDSCPPSPGCAVLRKELLPKSSGISFADVWQFSQSPKRTDFAGAAPLTTTRTGIATHPVLIRLSDCTWTLMLRLQAILLRVEPATDGRDSARIPTSTSQNKYSFEILACCSNYGYCKSTAWARRKLRRRSMPRTISLSFRLSG